MSDCDPMNCSLPGFSVHGILQARVMEWVANSFSRDLPPEDLPSAGIEPGSPALQADSLPSELRGKPQIYVINPKTIGPNTALIYNDKS